jgi:hypothetical protein
MSFPTSNTGCMAQQLRYIQFSQLAIRNRLTSLVSEMRKVYKRRMEELEGQTPNSSDGWRNAHPTPMQQSTEWKENPQHGSFSGLNLMHLGRHVVPPEELRTKHRFHMAFGIILKYYSQGLKPLGSTLSLSFQPSNPQSLTQVFWKFSPPSLIHRGRSTHRDVLY